MSPFTSLPPLALHHSPPPLPPPSWSFAFPGEWVHGGGKGDSSVCQSFAS